MTLRSLREFTEPAERGPLQRAALACVDELTQVSGRYSRMELGRELGLSKDTLTQALSRAQHGSVEGPCAAVTSILLRLARFWGLPAAIEPALGAVALGPEWDDVSTDLPIRGQGEPRQCSLEWCSRRHHGLGYCVRHYRRWKRGQRLYSLWDGQLKPCADCGKEYYGSYQSRYCSRRCQWRASGPRKRAAKKGRAA